MPLPTHPSIGQALMALQSEGLERLDAQLLLLHVLGIETTQRGWLLAHDTDLLPALCIPNLQALAIRRAQGEPLAYLTGSKSFYGLDLLVNPDVLIPRPDTETLVTWALEVLLPRPHAAALDMGTGSGAIALALKKQRPALQAWATDLSDAALAVAQANATRMGLTVRFAQGRWTDAMHADAPLFDAILSNPPYIADHDPHLPALRFEPLQALTSGSDGLNDLRHIIQSAPAHLKDGGWLLLEHGHDQADAVQSLLLQQGLMSVQSRCDLAGIVRCSGGQKPSQA